MFVSGPLDQLIVHMTREQDALALAAARTLPWVLGALACRGSRHVSGVLNAVVGVMMHQVSGGGQGAAMDVVHDDGGGGGTRGGDDKGWLLADGFRIVLQGGFGAQTQRRG